MSDHSLSPAWLAGWTSRVSGALAALTSEFERRHGYPPGANEVRPADRDDRTAARALALGSGIPADLVTFYDSVGAVTWADVGNGYFLDSAGDVLLRLQEHDAAVVGAYQQVNGLVIGSNGGGLCYVARPDGTVHRTRTASLDEPELDKVADDLRRFLELLERSLTQFVTDGEPGSL
ncbi:SMI1/KNR4 family protein [Streptomyces scabiei]|uniref:SMI1/KNR4 family protein n=1 Tax=Streptomyces TaxID=1883 RepID=UPI00211A27BD|nr:SMI1/KNR4 family protein [Streptomyces scabiei]MDX3118828.1 SMI1/KNR4 family protein [Streptomyces scabiei]